MAKVVAICNQKGGVGKTTTGINLAAFLAERGLNILLIDMDPQANTTSGLGIEKASLSMSLYNAVLGEVDIKDMILSTAVSGLDLIPSHPDLAGANVELVNAIGREFKLKKTIAPIRDMYDAILIDCPPSLGILTINALTAADSMLIPLQCEYYALEGLGQLMRTMGLVQEHLNPTLHTEGVLLTMADYRTKLTEEVINEAREHFKEQVYDTVIPRSVRLSEAPGYGKPIMLYNRTSQGAQAYDKLAEEFISRNPNISNRLGQKTASGLEPKDIDWDCLLYTSPSPRDRTRYRMPSSA